MTDAIALTVNGEPVGKQRPRFSGKSRTAYTPEKTANYEAAIRWLYKSNYHDFSFSKDIPLKMDIIAYFAVPKSDSRRQRGLKLMGDIKPTKKPDWDNIGKICCDALNGHAFHDDAQIVECNVTKRYSENPRVEIYIEPVIGQTDIHMNLSYIE